VEITRSTVAIALIALQQQFQLSVATVLILLTSEPLACSVALLIALLIAQSVQSITMPLIMHPILALTAL
jgi:hypothetical protein